ncbi:hypothetical protein, partial [Desulfovibrio litoralis]
MQKAFDFSGLGLFFRVLAFAFILSFTLPLAGNAADKKAEQEANVARVLARLNSQERQAAIAKMNEKNAEQKKIKDASLIQKASQSNNEKASVASKGEKTKTLVASDNAVTPSDSPKK